MATDQALVLAAHGSHHDSRAAAPVFALADRLREQRRFAVVRAAFWKEQPSLSEVPETIDAASVYVVPVTTSEGYFTDVVFPRELGLDAGGVRRAGRLHYADPVGTHERVVDVIDERVRAVTGHAVPPADVGVAIVGHGTPRHEDSADATAAHADELRARGRYAAVEPAFLDQAPAVATVTDRIDADAVVVVPFFVSNGRHVRRDVPAAIGLPTDGDVFGGPTAIGGTRVWYTEAVGTAPSLVEVVLDRAAEAGAGVRNPGSTPDDRTPAEAAFLRWLAGAADGGDVADRTRIWGELAVTVTSTDERRRYALRHRRDADVPFRSLDRLGTPEAVRSRTRFDDAGRYRPLATARTLPRGWRLETTDPGTLVATVRAVYPGSIDLRYRERTTGLPTRRFATVVGRQTGRYRELAEIDEATLSDTVEACCGDCVRRREWRAGIETADPTAGSFPCPEPCSFLLEAARTLDREGLEGAPPDEADPTVPAAAFGEPGNRTRVRFHEAARGERPPVSNP